MLLGKKAGVVVYIALMMVLATVGALAQNPDSQGTDFWLTFLPNYHTESGGPPGNTSDSLYIFIVGKVATTGTITYKNRNGQSFTKNFTIPDPSIIYSFKLNYYDYELVGYNDNELTTWQRNQDEVIAPQAFHITTDNEVTIYAHEQAVMTSEAFLVLPTDVLGKDNFVLTYNSDGSPTERSGKTPSQFAVVAVNDNTTIEIQPSAETYFFGIANQTVKMNAGDVYLVQAKITNSDLYNDMTGSYISSDKPVAVFAGQMRAVVPINIFSAAPSRDCLIEQMPPVNTWGQNAFIVPYAQPAQEDPQGTDLVRILAAYDSTDISLNGSPLVRLNRAGYYESALTTAGTITSTRPMLVMQYKKTSQFTGTNRTGDPFMMVMPPKEQFMSSYRFINTQAWELSQTTHQYQIVYTLQYIGLIVPTASLPSLTIDNITPDLSQFRPIPGTTDYSYANILMKDGVHEVKADKPFGLFIYGYGIADSYGYVGGMSFKILDNTPPVIATADTCYGINGVVYDSTYNDSGIKIAMAPLDQQNNVVVIVDNFSPYQDRVAFKASLMNKYQDGSFTITATDSMGLKTDQKYDIPGFTVAITGQETADTLPWTTQTVRLDKQFCYPAELYNYGKFPQTIETLSIKNPSVYTILGTTPLTLAPGEKKTVQVCFQSAVTGRFTDTLSIYDGCSIRQIAAYDIYAGKDESKPKIQSAMDSCLSSSNVIITDSLLTDFGLDTVSIVSTQNCTISKTFQDDVKAILKVSVMDMSKDAFYSIHVTDKAGNVTDVTDTIQGFTLAFPLLSTPEKIKNLGNMDIGTITCDNIDIYNFGVLPFTIKSLNFVINVLFSIPQSQLPMTIMPKETKKLEICYHPFVAAKHPDNDTLLLGYGCLSMTLPVTGKADTLRSQGNAKCDLPISIVTTKFPVEDILSQVTPTPIVDNGSIDFGIAEDSKVNISVYNYSGREILRVLDGYYTSGVYTYTFSVSDLPVGMYFCVMKTGRSVQSTIFTIIR
jgi:hypothetical protein